MIIVILDLMITIENDNFSFSKILSSKEIADIIKQVVKDSNCPLFSKLATGNIPNNSNIQKITESQCSPNCWCKQQ